MDSLKMEKCIEIVKAGGPDEGDLLIAIETVRRSHRYDLEPYLAEYLEHDSGEIRSASIIVLLGFWRMEKYLEYAISAARDDREEEHDVASGSVHALCEFGRSAKDPAKLRVAAEVILDLLATTSDVFLYDACIRGLGWMLSDRLSPQLVRQLEATRDTHGDFESEMAKSREQFPWASFADYYPPK